MSLSRLILIVFICLVCLIAILFRKNIEKFEASPLLIFRVTQSKDKININTQNKDILDKLVKFSWMTFNEKSLLSSLSLEVTDTLSYHLMSGTMIKRAVTVALGNKKHFYMLKGINSIPEESLEKAIDANRKFYAKSDVEKFILRAIMMASGLHPNKIIWSTKESDADIICKYDYLILPLNQKPRGSFISYENIDIHKLKVIIPFVQTEGVDMSIYYDLSGEKFPVKTCIFFKTLLWTNHIGKIREVEWINDILLAVGDIDDSNYYTRYFDFLPEVLEIMKNHNLAIIDRRRLPILEQYVDVQDKDQLAEISEKIVIEASREVPGYYDHKLRTFVLEKEFIDGIPLDIAERVILKRQSREEENGVYVYKRPFLVKKEELGGQYMADKTAANEFVCIGDETIKNKGLCESAFDAMGTPKPIGSWDRPCTKNEECPFYQSNTHYKNYRGGCNNGYCEMPLGINRIGYTKYDKENDKSKPLCYGCPIDDPYCCDKQVNPDYAFELDEMERHINFLK